MQHLPPGDESYSKNVKEQYEALGRFIEAFELMVDEVRGISTSCIFDANDTVGKIKPAGSTWQDWIKEEDRSRRLIDIAFHHQAMTAKPLFDVMRAIIAEFVNYPPSFHYAERALFRNVLSHIEREFNSLYWKRNDLVHATWFIGARSEDDPAASTFYIRKFKTSADGLKRAAELPKNAGELLILRDRCTETCAWLSHVGYCLRQSARLSDYFKLEANEWKLFTRPGAVGATLPSK
jgi:hypothetical protein